MTDVAKAGPPYGFVRDAIVSAGMSPCAKSKRGAVLYRPGDSLIVSGGWNGLPRPFFCDGSEQCREDCGRNCMHAEQRALDHARRIDGTRYVLEWRRFVMLHVKVTATGDLVAAALPRTRPRWRGGGPPSCWQCSRAMLEAGIAGVWLYQAVGGQDILGYIEAIKAAAGAPTELLLAPSWRYYTTLEFHTATLKNCGIWIPPTT